MDGPNNGVRGPGKPDTQEHLRNIRQAGKAHQEQILQRVSQYQPEIHEQVQRIFSQYEPTFYARMLLRNRAISLQSVEDRISIFAAGRNRPMSDSETQVLGEYFLASTNDAAICSLAVTGWAALMTYRGRATFRFPLYTPRVTPVNLNGAIPARSFLMHVGRFAAYWVIGSFFAAPCLNFAENRRIVQEPRLRALWEESKKREPFRPGALQDGSVTATQTSPSQYAPQTFQEQPRIPKMETQYSHPSESWDANLDDDASPVSPSSQNRSGSTGSAWDRVRQQSQGPTSSQRSLGNQWKRSTQAGGWDDASPQRAWPRDGDTFTRADEQSALERSQAQREFDRLLDQERQGVDQESPRRGR